LAIHQGLIVHRTFASKGGAVQAAITVACSSGKCGNQAVVLTKSTDGEFIPVWIHGLDCYSTEA
jgi:hypothetical protein